MRCQSDRSSDTGRRLVAAGVALTVSVTSMALPAIANATPSSTPEAPSVEAASAAQRSEVLARRASAGLGPRLAELPKLDGNRLEWTLNLDAYRDKKAKKAKQHRDSSKDQLRLNLVIGSKKLAKGKAYYPPSVQPVNKLAVSKTLKTKITASGNKDFSVKIPGKVAKQLADANASTMARRVLVYAYHYKDVMGRGQGQHDVIQLSSSVGFTGKDKNEDKIITAMNKSIKSRAKNLRDAANGKTASQSAGQDVSAAKKTTGQNIDAALASVANYTPFDQAFTMKFIKCMKNPINIPAQSDGFLELPANSYMEITGVNTVGVQGESYNQWTQRRLNHGDQSFQPYPSGDGYMNGKSVWQNLVEQSQKAAVSAVKDGAKDIGGQAAKYALGWAKWMWPFGKKPTPKPTPSPTKSDNKAAAAGESSVQSSEASTEAKTAAKSIPSAGGLMGAVAKTAGKFAWTLMRNMYDQKCSRTKGQFTTESTVIGVAENGMAGAKSGWTEYGSENWSATRQVPMEAWQTKTLLTNYNNYQGSCWWYQCTLWNQPSGSGDDTFWYPLNTGYIAGGALDYPGARDVLGHVGATSQVTWNWGYGRGQGVDGVDRQPEPTIDDGGGFTFTGGLVQGSYAMSPAVDLVAGQHDFAAEIGLGYLNNPDVSYGPNPARDPVAEAVRNSRGGVDLTCELPQWDMVTPFGPKRQYQFPGQGGTVSNGFSQWWKWWPGATVLELGSTHTDMERAESANSIAASKDGKPYQGVGVWSQFVAQDADGNVLWSKNRNSDNSGDISPALGEGANLPLSQREFKLREVQGTISASQIDKLVQAGTDKPPVGGTDAIQWGCTVSASANLIPDTPDMEELVGGFNTATGWKSIGHKSDMVSVQ